MKNSYEGIGQWAATFACSNVAEGQVVKISGNGEVTACADGDKFCGVVMEPRTGIAGVQFKGFMTVPCAGELTPGWATLAADGNGGVKSADTGVTALVMGVNSDGTAVICL